MKREKKDMMIPCIKCNTSSKKSPYDICDRCKNLDNPFFFDDKTSDIISYPKDYKGKIKQFDSKKVVYGKDNFFSPSEIAFNHSTSINFLSPSEKFLEKPHKNSVFVTVQ